MKYYLIAMGTWNLVRAFIHSLHHGYDILFEVRMLACIIPICFSALVVVVEQSLKNSPYNKPQSFNTIQEVPSASTMQDKIIYLKQSGRFYRSNVLTWEPVE